MILFVNDKSKQVVELSVEPTMTMAGLKEKIQQAFDCPPEQQRLVFGRTVLDDIDSVRDSPGGVSRKYPLTLQRLPAGGAKTIAIYSTQINDYITIDLSIDENFTVQDTKEYIFQECSIPVEDQWLEVEMLDLRLQQDCDAKPIASLFTDFDLANELSLDGEDVYSLIVRTVPMALVKATAAHLESLRNGETTDSDTIWH